MSAAVLLDLGALDPALRLDGHLPECPHRRRPPDGCDWCLWAVEGAGVRDALDVIRDADTLTRDHDRRGGDVSVAWVVATGDLLDACSGEQLGASSPVPSVRDLADRLGRLRDDRCRPLRHRLDSATAADGPVERRCLSTAGPLAAAALQRPEHTEMRDRLPAPVRDRLDHATSLLSADTQTAGLLPSVEARHWDGLPALRTQTAWARRRRPDPDRSGAPRSGSQRSGSKRWETDRQEPDRTGPCEPARPAPGSLEALVVESVIDGVVDELAELGVDLAAASDPVAVPRPPSRTRMSERTRAMSWRIARIDWHLTYLDTGRAGGWPATTSVTPDGTGSTADLVPWTVALAIAEGERAGLVSATHTC